MRFALLVSLATSFLASPLAAEPLRVADDRLWLPVVVEGVPVEALLDSGAEVTVLDRSFGDGLAVAVAGEVEARGTGAGPTTARLVENLALRALGRDVALPVVAVMDLSDVAARLTGGQLPVVLGREIFDSGRLAIDIEAGEIGWLAGNEAPAGIRLPLTAAHGVETIPVTIAGETVQADFDLGNGTGVLVSRGLADKLGLAPVGMEPAGGIGGAMLRPVVYLADVVLAGHRVTGVRAHVLDGMKVEANIGVGLLRQFRIVTDFPGREIWLAAR